MTSNKRQAEDEPVDSQNPLQPAPKRPRLAIPGTDSDPGITRRSSAKLSRADYTIGWVCALHVELAAAQTFLDERHETLPSDANDTNTYAFGRIHHHNIVIVCLPHGGYGTNNAATVAVHMHRSFPSLRMQLMVGVGGGVPTKGDVRLGDVVVGEFVVQHDLGKIVQDGRFELVGRLYQPPQEIMTAVTALQAEIKRNPNQLHATLHETLRLHPHVLEYSDSSKLQGCLCDDAHDHAESHTTYQGHDTSGRCTRPSRDDGPRIHYGTIASGNQVIKDAQERNKLVETLEQTFRSLPPILCVEMEAAGLMNGLPSLAIRGICDYANSRKDKQWQPYAAATAAACAKELLSFIPQRGSQNASTPSPGRREELLDSLRFERIDSRHEEIRDAHIETCEWLLQDPQYLDWLNSGQLSRHHGFLWIKGKPGSGKSTLMKYLLGKTKTRTADRNAVTLAFFFNARGGDLEKSTTGMFRSLLSQLLKQVPELQHVLDDLPQVLPEDGMVQWDRETVRKLLLKTIPKLGSRRFTCFIDALDECDDDQVREMIADFEDIGRVTVQSASQFYVCFSSRHYPHIHIETGMQLILENQVGHTEDLEKYVRRKLKIGASKAAQKTKQDVIKKAGGVFLWVVLVVPILQKEFDNGRIDRVKRRLQELPPELSGLFRDILRRDNDDLDSLLLCVQWILYARHPLKPEEFYYAVLSGLNPDSDTLSERDPEYITADVIQKFVLGSSKGLAEMTRSTKPTVQFIHESVRDFLIKDKGLSELFPELEQNLQSSCHNRLKQCCQVYLQANGSDCIGFADIISTASSKEAKDLRQQLPDRYPFLKYAVHQILHHADVAAIAYPQEGFLQEFDFPSWIKLRNAFEIFAIRLFDSSTSRQYILAENNQSNLLSEILKIDPETDVKGGRHCFPLLTAAFNGNENSVKLLLEKGANIEVKTEKGRTALWLAAEKGHLGIARMLLEGKANAAHGNPLHSASVNGYDTMVTLLLDRGADVNVKGGHYGNALQAASAKGYNNIVAQLLDGGADPNTQGGYYGTALHAASAGGHDKIVALLLDGGADSNTQGGPYGNALHAALDRGYDKIVALLLDGGADPNTQGGYYGTALQAASAKGYGKIVALLLNRGADPNTQDGPSGNALQAASERGHDKIVALLLDAGADPNTQGGPYGNALQAASAGGYDKIVALLLDRGVDVNAQGGHYDNALYAASAGGYDKVVALLLDRGVDVNAQGGYYGTALQAASARGYDKIVALLCRSTTM